MEVPPATNVLLQQQGNQQSISPHRASLSVHLLAVVFSSWKAEDLDTACFPAATVTRRLGSGEQNQRLLFNRTDLQPVTPVASTQRLPINMLLSQHLMPTKPLMDTDHPIRNLRVRDLQSQVKTLANVLRGVKVSGSQGHPQYRSGSAPSLDDKLLRPQPQAAVLSSKLPLRLSAMVPRNWFQALMASRSRCRTPMNMLNAESLRHLHLTKVRLFGAPIFLHVSTLARERSTDPEIS